MPRAPKLLAPLEGYALIPSILALSLLGVDRSGMPSLLKFCFFLGLAGLGFFICRMSLDVLVIVAAVLLDKSLFFNSQILYGAAVLAGGLLFFNHRWPSEQTPIGICLSAIYSLGLITVLAPGSILRWTISGLLAFSTVLLFGCWAKGTFSFSEIALNPLRYLDKKLCPGPNAYNANRDRFSLYCIFFLVLGATEWSQLVELFGFRAAALIHLAISIVLPTAILSLLKIPFDSAQYPEAVALVPVATGPSLEERLAALEAERLYRERQELLKREHQFFFGQTWDQLAACFTNHLQTALPDGSVINANDHFFLGIATEQEQGDLRYKPILLHRRILEEHIHILGGTGSGKTSLGITPILIQLIRGFAVPDGKKGAVKPSEPHPIVIFDIKGDLALFHTAKEEAAANGQEFLFFTVDHTKASYYFNPFLSLRRHGATVSEQAHQLLDSLGLNHGEQYGASYFTRIGRQALLQLLREGGTPQSLKDLYNQLKKNPKKQKQAEELYAALEGLIDYPQLFTTKEQEEKNPETIIDFDRVLERNQVVYFWLTAPTQSLAVREIGKLAIYSYFMSAIHRYSSGKRKQTYLIIDEFQRLIGENLAQIVEQARGFGIGAIFANQNIDQLDTRDGKLWSLINSNVRASLHFGSGDPDEKKLLSEASGEVIEKMRTTSTSKGLSAGETRGRTRGSSRSSNFDGVTHGVSEGTSESESVTKSQGESESFEEAYRARFRIEDLGEWFNEEQQFLLWVRRGSGHSSFGGRPIQVSGLYTIDEMVYKKRLGLPWPEGPRPSLESPKGSSGPTKEELLAKLNIFKDE